MLARRIPPALQIRIAPFKATVIENEEHRAHEIHQRMRKRRSRWLEGRSESHRPRMPG